MMLDWDKLLAAYRGEGPYSMVPPDPVLAYAGLLDRIWIAHLRRAA